MMIKNDLNMSCDDFINFVRKAIQTGIVKVSVPLSDFDIAVMWAVDRIGEKKNFPCDVSTLEIWNELPEKYRTEDNCR